MKLDLGIIIVNYNTGALLRDCLRSVYANADPPSRRVCVVDNASPDESAAIVRAEFPQVLLIESPHNLGYARANNLGLKALGFGRDQSDAPRYALLLNPDTVVPPTALRDLVAYMEAHPEAGVVGPKLVLRDGSLDLACRRSFPTPQVSFYRMIGLSRLFPQSRRFGRYNMTFLDPDVEAEIDSVVGACMLVRGEVIAQVGLLDEQFFMYAEDLDWCKRIKEAQNPRTGQAWQVRYYPGVTILHYKRASSQYSRRAQFEFYYTMYIFYRKHYAAQTPFWLHGLVVGGILLRGGLALWRQVVLGQPAFPRREVAP